MHRNRQSDDRLDSWKEIAAYLKRDVATVRRWEKREGLPVHRHHHEKLGSVYAYASELDAWAEGRREQVELAPRPPLIDRRRATGAALVAIGLAAIAVLGYQLRQSPAPAAAPPGLRIAVHRPGTVAGLVAAGLHDVLRRALPEADVALVEEPGMLDTLRAMEAGQVDLGLAFNLVAFHAAKTDLVLGHRGANITALTVAYPNPAQLVVRRDSPIRTIADLKGRRVNLGVADAGGRFCSEILLAHFGLPTSAFSDQFMDVDTSLQHLLDGRIDALLDWRGVPGPDQTSAFAGGELRLVPLDVGSIEGLRVKNPFLVPWVIPARVFPNQDAAVSTVSARMLLLGSRALPASVVERILSAIAASKSDLIARHPAAAEINLTKKPTMEEGLSIDLHPGAERFFQASATR